LRQKIVIATAELRRYGASDAAAVKGELRCGEWRQARERNQQQPNALRGAGVICMAAVLTGIMTFINAM
jgi:hypothetical protein